MPELPEVEIICRGLRSSIINSVIKQTKVFCYKLRKPVDPNISSKLHNKRIIDIQRRAKYILIMLSDKTSLIIHLGMSGRIVIEKNPSKQQNKHDHILFFLDNGYQLIFNDPRRFGLVCIADSDSLGSHKCLAHLGIEPLSNEFNENTLYSILQKKTTNIKKTLMNASLIVGIGNIYVCEILFQSNIHPETISSKISKNKINKLYSSIKNVLEDAILAGGSTLKDYVNSSGDKGYFQTQLQVYGKEGKECQKCSTIVKKIKQFGRSSFFCPECQKVNN